MEGVLNLWLPPVLPTFRRSTGDDLSRLWAVIFGDSAYL